MMAYYRKKAIQEIIPWEVNIPMALVSVSEADKNNGSPKIGDMIAFDQKNPTDMWLIAEEFFANNYEFVSEY